MRISRLLLLVTFVAACAARTRHRFDLGDVEGMCVSIHPCVDSDGSSCPFEEADAVMSCEIERARGIAKTGATEEAFDELALAIGRSSDSHVRPPNSLRRAGRVLEEFSAPVRARLEKAIGDGHLDVALVRAAFLSRV